MKRQSTTAKVTIETAKLIQLYTRHIGGVIVRYRGKETGVKWVHNCITNRFYFELHEGVSADIAGQYRRFTIRKETIKTMERELAAKGLLPQSKPSFDVLVFTVDRNGKNPEHFRTHYLQSPQKAIELFAAANDYPGIKAVVRDNSTGALVDENTLQNRYC